MVPAFWERESTKVILPTLLAFTLFGVAIFVFLLPAFHTHLLNKKKDAVRELVNTGVSILAHYQQLAEKGTLSLPEAQAQARVVINALRYGPAGKDYFWINDLQPAMISHPYRPDLEGRNLAELTDQTGKKLFVEFVRTVREKGKGFVPYQWQRHDNSSQEEEKLSFVRLFPAWGWIVGTGIYLGDVQQEMASLSRRLLAASAAILLLVGLLAGYSVTQGVKSVRRRQDAEETLSRYRDHLEELVAERTKELAAVNATLRQTLRAQQQIEEELRESEQKYRTLVEQANDGIVILQDGLVRYANQQAATLFGYSLSELLEMPVDRLTAPDSPKNLPAFRPDQAEKQACKTEALLWRKNNEQLAVEISSARIGYQKRPADLLFIHDLSERQQLEKERLKTRNLESIRLLAGGIAHDFNNLLMAILGNLSMARELKNEAETAQFLENSETGALRARDLVKQLLFFAEEKFPGQTRHHLAKLIEHTVRFCCRPEIDCSCSIAPDLWPLHCDPLQIRQLLTNLLTNAQEAMDREGKLLIAAENRELGEGEVATLPAGKYVALLCSDSGRGIAPENLPRILDPYFSTKARGAVKGMGLGLSIVFTIVQDHRGQMEIDSRPGAGTVVRIYLPAAASGSPPFSQQENLPEEIDSCFQP